MSVSVTVTALRVFLAARWQVTGNQEVPLDIARLKRNTGLPEETIQNCLTNSQLYLDGIMIRTVVDGENRYRRAMQALITILDDRDLTHSGLQFNTIYNLDKPAIAQQVEDILIKGGLLVRDEPATFSSARPVPPQPASEPKPASLPPANQGKTLRFLVVPGAVRMLQAIFQSEEPVPQPELIKLAGPKLHAHAYRLINNWREAGLIVEAGDGFLPGIQVVNLTLRRGKADKKLTAGFKAFGETIQLKARRFPRQKTGSQTNNVPLPPKAPGSNRSPDGDPVPVTPKMVNVLRCLTNQGPVAPTLIIAATGTTGTTLYPMLRDFCRAGLAEKQGDGRYCAVLEASFRLRRGKFRKDDAEAGEGMEIGTVYQVGDLATESKPAPVLPKRMVVPRKKPRRPRKIKAIARRKVAIVSKKKAALVVQPPTVTLEELEAGASALVQEEIIRVITSVGRAVGRGVAKGLASVSEQLLAAAGAAKTSSGRK